MAEVFDLRALVSADVSPFEKAMDRSADSVTSSLSLINTAANAYIGSGFIRTLIKATNTAYEFEQVMADISSISSVNTEKMAKSIRGLDNVYGKLSDVANSAYEIISSGFDRSADEVLHFQKTISTTAKTIRADINATTNAMTTLANAYGIPLNQAQKISDMLFVTVREGKAQGNELARTLGLVTNTAAEAGVTLAEMAATISILSRTQSASQSMIGFNQMLNSLIKPTQEAQREAKKWGIEIGAAALQSKGFTAILTEMHDKIGGNVEAINAILGNIRAMRAGTALTGRQFENFIKVLREAEKEIGSGTSLEAFAKQTATAQQALKNLEVQADKTYEVIGRDFEPITKNIIQISEGVLKSFTDASPIRRWLAYATAMHLTFKAISNVVREMKSQMSAIGNALGAGRGAGISGIIQSARADISANRAAIRENEKTFIPFSTLRAFDVGGTLKGTFSEDYIKSHYQRMLKGAEEEYAQMQDNARKRRTVLSERLSAEREYVNSVKTEYTDYKNEMSRYMTGLKTEHSKTLATLRENQTKLANLSVWDFAGSNALVQSQYKTVFTGAGGRSFYNTKMAKELADASTQYLNMVTEADVDAVLQKKLNPLKGQIRDIAEANIAKMYHIVQDEEGAITGAIDPRTGAMLDYDSLVAKENKRVSNAFRSSRLVYNTLKSTQSSGVSKFEDQSKVLNEAIAQQKHQLKGLKAEIDASNKDLGDSRAIVADAVAKGNKRIAALKFDMQQLDEAQYERRKYYQDEIAAIKSSLKGSLRAYNEQKHNNAERLELQRNVEQAEKELLALEQARVNLFVRNKKALRKVLQGAVGEGKMPTDAYGREMLKTLLYDTTARRVLMSEYTDEYGGVSTEGRKVRRALAFQRLKQRRPDIKAESINDLGVVYNTGRAFRKFMTSGVSFSKIANGLATFPTIISTAIEGWKVGVAIAEHFKFAESKLFMFIGNLDEWTRSWLSIRPSKLRTGEEQKQIDAKLLEDNKKINSTLILRLEKEGKLTVSAASLEMKQVALAKTMEELAGQYKRLIKEVKTKAPKVPTIESLKKEMEDALKNKTDVDFTAKQRAIVIKGANHVINKLSGYNSATRVMTRFGPHETLTSKVSKGDFDALLGADNIQAVEKAGAELLKRVGNVKAKIPGYNSVRDKYVNDVTALVQQVIAIVKDATKLTQQQRQKLLQQQRQDIKRDFMGRMLDTSYSQYESSLSDISNRSNERRKQRDLDAAVDYTGGDSVGIREAGRETNTFLYDAQRVHDEREKAYLTLKADGERIKEDFRKRGLSEKTIASKMQKWEGNLVTAYTQLNTAKQELDKRTTNMLEASVKYMQEQKDTLLSQGFEEDSVPYTLRREGQLSDEIKRLNRVLDQTINEQAKARIGKRIADLEGQRSKLYSGEASAISGMRDRRLRAGEIGEATALAEEIELYRSQQRRAQERVAELSQSNVYGKASRLSTAQRDLTTISLKLAEAMRKLDDETRKVSSGIFSGVQGMLSPYSDENRGRMSNNQLFHSLNMMSRITGPSLIQRGLMPVTTRNNVRYRDTQSRVQAEQKVYSAIDSYIMSKKYEEANIGKTVNNIYDYIRDNNKIMVSK